MDLSLIEWIQLKPQGLNFASNLLMFRKCPDEIQESVCSVIFAAPYLEQGNVKCVW